MIYAKIPFEFLQRLCEMPSWSVIAYGYDNLLLSHQAVIDYACDKIAKVSEPKGIELEIASSSVGDLIADKILTLAADSGANDMEEIRSCWGKILLAWIYEHRCEIDDLQVTIDEIDVDLNYPSELIPFTTLGSYTLAPIDRPYLETAEAREQLKLEKIGEFVSQFIRCKSS